MVQSVGLLDQLLTEVISERTQTDKPIVGRYTSKNKPTNHESFCFYHRSENYMAVVGGGGNSMTALQLDCPLDQSG